MTIVRVFHHPNGTIRAREHRADEPELGADAYTQDNIPLPYIGFDWFTCYLNDSYDTEGEIPFEALRVIGSGPGRRVTPDVAEPARLRQLIKDRTKGAGGRIDQLHAKLSNYTITPAEINEMLRIERGL